MLFKRLISTKICLSIIFFILVVNYIIIPIYGESFLENDINYVIKNSVKNNKKSLLDNQNKTDKIIVAYKDNIQDMQYASNASFHKVNVQPVFNKKLEGLNTEIVKFSNENDAQEAIKTLKQDNNVKYVEPDYKLKPHATAVKNSEFTEQWGLVNTGKTFQDESEGDFAGISGIDINILKAWDITKGDKSVTVGLLDTGIDTNHKDINSNIYVNPNEIANDGIDNDANGFIDDIKGWDFVDKDNQVYEEDLSDHGTHIAGIIAGKPNGSKGITGVAPNVKILPIRVLGNEGFVSEALQGINYAKKMGIKIVNCSFGQNEYSLTLYNAIKESGMLFVCSAGNEATFAYNYPSSFDLPNIISVANNDNKGELSIQSNYGEENVDISAPGKIVYSSIAKNNYKYMSGTSMSAAHVTGICALLLSKNPQMTNNEIINRIKKSGMKLDSLDKLVQTGSITDAYAALSDIQDLGLNVVSTGTSNTINWREEPGATSYNIEVDGEVINNGNLTTYTHRNLTKGTSHYYRVRAITNSKVGLWSNKVMKIAGYIVKNGELNIQTSHNYSDNLFKTFTISKTNASKMRIHFRKIEILPDDYLVFYRGEDTYRVSGSYLNGVWSHWNRSNSMMFDFETDTKDNSYGFYIDKVEYIE